MTTPFEREVLTHHYITTTPFPRRSELYDTTVERFVTRGLLQRGDDGDVYANAEALEVYMEALAAVPLPERHWVIPTHPNGRGDGK